MTQISFITPLDQPLGSKRLLDVLRAGLADPRYTRLRIVVAYAKSGPLLRLQSELESWKKAGNSLCAIFGVDQQGTSEEAVNIAASFCDELYITRERGITFHPKIFLFDGPNDAKAIVGSNNLTVGGTETNFETAAILDLVFPVDEGVYAELDAMWTNLLPHLCVATKLLDENMLNELIATSVLLPEGQIRARSKMTANYPVAPISGLARKPASPIPAAIMKKPRNAVAAAQPPAIPLQQQAVSGLAIQIKPHHNGEIFLSTIAVSQNPHFFGWPFTGVTTPKKAGNVAYPQRSPDPVVNIDVYGAMAAPLLNLRGFKLNTVYYSAKSEIRITASPLVSEVPEYSIMVMTPGSNAGIDYDISIYRPDSPHYPLWLGACNQNMPGGGKIPRKFGWF